MLQTLLPSVTAFLSGVFIGLLFGLLLGYILPCRRERVARPPTPMSEKLRMIVVLVVCTIFLVNNVADFVLDHYDVPVALQVTLGAILGTTMRVDLSFLSSMFNIPRNAAPKKVTTRK